PTFLPDAAFWTTVVAVLGTTISPYLFFWQAAQEVEDIRVEPERKPLVKAPQQGPDAIERIRLDTYIGMAFSNLVALAIIVTTAPTLHASGITDISSSSDAAEALRPVAGPFAFTLFALGIVGTGLLAVPVLAGSAAYAIGEARRWPVGLGRKPEKAKAFYATLTIATMVGVALNFSPINPIKALYWSAVINGVVAVPVMITMMHMTANAKVMGKFPVHDGLRWIGWMATAVMAAAAIPMGVPAIVGPSWRGPGLRNLGGGIIVLRSHRLETCNGQGSHQGFGPTGQGQGQGGRRQGNRRQEARRGREGRQGRRESPQRRWRHEGCAAR